MAVKMNQLPENPTLREINRFKKQLNWGEIPAVYHMASIAVSDIDGILNHGFDSAYKQILNRNNWNLSLLQGTKDKHGVIHVKQKPKIMLEHIFNDTHYELHCFPVINDGYVTSVVKYNPHCPFILWIPEKMQMLFRLSNFLNFMIYTVKKGDEADIALVKFAYEKVEQLITYLKESFDIVKIKGRDISHIYAELEHKYLDHSKQPLFVIPLNRES
jgi:hypothetical protein